jgi:hypothetical protein
MTDDYNARWPQSDFPILRYTPKVTALIGYVMIAVGIWFLWSR